jgi:shikimate dehydrogenase
MQISGKTKIVGIFGHPIEHTLSPLMHNSAFEAMGLDICYVAFDVSPEDLKDAVRAIKALGLLGVNVTIPHKEKVIQLLDTVDEEALFIGAVNTIVHSDGRLYGYNTDGRGFLHSLSEEGVSFEGKRILIIGAGGAARAISYCLGEKAASLHLYDIDRAKAERLVNDLNRFQKGVYLLDDLRNMGGQDILINATPLGWKDDDPLPVEPEAISPEMVVCDLVYKNTRLLKEAKEKGAKAINGSGMLLWQGALAFELWTGKRPPVELMRKVLLSNIRR